MAKTKTQPRRKPAKAKASIQNSTLSYPEAWLRDAFTGGVEASSGERVNEKIAMMLPAFFACVRNISEDVAKLPFGIYKRLNPRGSERQRKHPADWLIFREPNPEMSALVWRETVTAHALAYHGGFSEIVFDGAGRPTEIWPLDPTSVQVMRTQDERRLLFYMVDNKPVPAENMLHIKGLGYDGITGYALARMLKEAIGSAIAAQKFSGTFFANGTTLSGVLEVPDALSETAFKHLRESFHARHGSADRQHKPLILEQGTKYSPISSDPEKSQMTDTIYLNDEQIYKIFRMPPHMVGDLRRATFSNIEHQALEYVKYTLGRWLCHWEQEIDRKLLQRRERIEFFSKHNDNALLRGDSAARAAFYHAGIFDGWLSDNDVRELEDLNPIEGGDTYFVQSAMVPLEMAAEGEHLSAKQPEVEPKPEENPDDEPPDNEAMNRRREIVMRMFAAQREQLKNTLTSLMRVEHDKATRAAKRTDGVREMLDFYKNGHVQRVADQLSPIFDGFEAILEAAKWN